MDAGCIYAATNFEYLRLRALSKLALSTEYRQEVLAGNLDGWIIGGSLCLIFVWVVIILTKSKLAYQYARARFGDLPATRPYGIMWQESYLLSDVVNGMAGDLPMVTPVDDNMVVSIITPYL